MFYYRSYKINIQVPLWAHDINLSQDDTLLKYLFG